MKVIFLDVDGVLNGGKTDGYSRKLIGDVYFQRLKRLVDTTNAKVVLSSSWRIGYDPESHAPSKTLHDKLKGMGVDLYGMTPLIKWFDGKTRGDEIREWLVKHPEVDHFVILDDDCDMAEYTETNLVKTDTKVGLQDDDVDKAIAILIDTVTEGLGNEESDNREG